MNINRLSIGGGIIGFMLGVVLPVVMGALLTYKDLGRDLDHYKETAGWVSSAISSFQTEMKRYDRSSVEARRLITVLQGWEVSPEELAAQISQSTQSGSGGYVIAKTPVLSQWEPRLVSLDVLRHSQVETPRVVEPRQVHPQRNTRIFHFIF
ncbi:MAG: hypothetical protein ISQ73_16165 [Verrucomicrobiae bacterium]|nr:hypothetical protein [Verrucomicrobiae bacterium]HAQ99043.1 hypothetical protein [Verrucomicrobiales bacterium]